MDVLHALLQYGRELLHLSPLDWFVAALVVMLTFGSHILRLVRMAGDEYVEFTRWRREFRQRCREARHQDARPPDAADVAPPPACCKFCNAASADRSLILQPPQDPTPN
jgi:hypothetical protein